MLFGSWDWKISKFRLVYASEFIMVFGLWSAVNPYMTMKYANVVARSNNSLYSREMSSRREACSNGEILRPSSPVVSPIVEIPIFESYPPGYDSHKPKTMMNPLA